uniref:Semaphorin-4A-like n=1 Tax=Erpetoichthys calabaricus TaxID=27687 RepID=A0A8C4X381_ERPCA
MILRTANWCICLQLALLQGLVSDLTPRLTFSIHDQSRLVVHFRGSEYYNTTTLLLNNDQEILFVGARDAILVVNISQPGIMKLRNVISWEASPIKKQECVMKGKNSMTDCFNYIRVLLPLNETSLYVCGTYAFSPMCAYVDSRFHSNSIDMAIDDGKGRCPFDPYQRHTAIIVDGELYAGTVSNFQGSEPAISRYLGEPNRMGMKVDNALGWLQDPTFINSVLIRGRHGEDRVYFFFSEQGKEYDFVEKYTVSRIAQVCTSDVGGVRVLQKRWTTFVKAEISCVSPGEMPFNVIHDVFTLHGPRGTADETLFYGVFSSQWYGVTGQSAVCAFNLKQVKEVFNGNYKKLDRDTQRWVSKPEINVKPGKCDLNNTLDSILTLVKETFLADERIKPEGSRPLLVSRKDRYKKIAVHKVQTYTVLFLLTENGALHKVVLLKNDVHIIEEIQLFSKPQAVENLILSPKKRAVFVGSSEGIFQVPFSNCSVYQSCGDCILARDPFCGWDVSHNICTETDLHERNLVQDIENGNASKHCSTQSIKPRMKNVSSLKNKNMIDETITVTMYQPVTLNCSVASQKAYLKWELPSKKIHSYAFFKDNNRTIVFITTKDTLGEFKCISVENGFEQFQARYIVKEKDTIPFPAGHTSNRAQAVTQYGETSQPETTVTGESGTSEMYNIPEQDITVNLSKKDEAFFKSEKQDTETMKQTILQKSYYSEFVTVMVLLTIAVIFIVLGVVSLWYQRNREKARVQGCDATGKVVPGECCPQEQVPFTEEKGQISVQVDQKGAEVEEMKNKCLSTSNGKQKTEE